MGTVSVTLPSDGQTIDASDVNSPINAILAEFNGNIDDNNIKTGANINGSKLLAGSLPGSALDTTLAGGWISGVLPAQSGTIVNNGNRSYDIPFASTVASILTPGTRLKITRTATAPTQCADLESGSSQYFNRASGSLSAGFASITSVFTAMAWVKLESYTAMGIISRIDANDGWDLRLDGSGRIQVTGRTTGAGTDSAITYQSIPLNRWVHVAAAFTISSSANTKIYIDGIEVPSAFTDGADGAIGVPAVALEVGALVGASFFDGKLAQVGFFSAALTGATIRSYMSQGLSGSETNILAAYSLSNAITDLTSNGNNLTAQGGALATATDSPFGQDSNGVTAGTTDYALVMKVSTTTATVQVPEGCTIPTSGGVSAVAYSTASSPFGFTMDKGRWRLSSILGTSTVTTSNATYGAFSSAGYALTVPTGSWEVGHSGAFSNSTTTTVVFNVSKTALTGLSIAAGHLVSPLGVTTKSAAAATSFIPAMVSTNDTLPSATTYVMYTIGATASAGISGDAALAEIFAIPAGI